jgi:hypothetical protein
MTHRRIAVLGAATCAWMVAAMPVHAEDPPAPAPQPPGAVAAPVPKDHAPAAAVPAPQLAKTDGSRLLGQKVSSLDGQDLGRIVDVLVGPESKPVAAVIDITGFMGLGTRKVAVEWPLLRFPAPGVTGPIGVALPADQVRSAPEYKADGKPAVVVVQPPVGGDTVAASPEPPPASAAPAVTAPNTPAPADPPSAETPAQAAAPH